MNITGYELRINENEFFASKLLYFHFNFFLAIEEVFIVDLTGETMEKKQIKAQYFVCFRLKLFLPPLYEFKYVQEGGKMVVCVFCILIVLFLAIMAMC